VILHVSLAGCPKPPEREKSAAGAGGDRKY